MRHRPLVLALLIGVLAASPGCGDRGNRIWVSGKLLKGETKYIPPEDQVVNITFVSLEVQDASGKLVKGGDQYAAELDPSGETFSVPGPDRQGIPPGKYRVAVTQKMKREAFDAAKKKTKKKKFTRETDMLEGRFGTANSPFVVQVNQSDEVTIDLDKIPAAPPPPRSPLDKNAGAGNSVIAVRPRPSAHRRSKAGSLRIPGTLAGRTGEV